MLKQTEMIIKPDESLGFNARMTHRAFTRALQARLTKHNIPIGQWYYLRVLWREDGLTQKALSDQLGIMGPTTVVALRAMERDGLIKRVRNESDRRKINIYLSEKGKALETELSPYIDDINLQASDEISEADIEAFKRVSEKIRLNLEAFEAAA
ncbi:MarR family winged helix-turn-helix transcriptional regulator [Curvivirga sp.]|uniref:MarR family winged helix-turn-helix transcriptional regulator n=1 Tax=Curvivirga sp. TaxID=2856848 RepID=UPI003B5C38DB